MAVAEKRFVVPFLTKFMWRSSRALRGFTALSIVSTQFLVISILSLLLIQETPIVPKQNIADKLLLQLLLYLRRQSGGIKQNCSSCMKHILLLLKETITWTQPEIFTLSVSQTSSEEACSVLLPVLAMIEVWRGQTLVVRVAQRVAAVRLSYAPCSNDTF